MDIEKDKKDVGMKSVLISFLFSEENVLYYWQKGVWRDMVNEIYSVLNDMSEVLNMQQLQRLQETLLKHLVEKGNENNCPVDNGDYLDMFISAKKIEGCSERTLSYYKATIQNMFKEITISVMQITTEMLRDYLAKYQLNNNCGKVTIDNIRRNAIDTEDYDVIKGWRANASYFYIAKAFVRDEIDLDILEELLHLGDLGIQYCLKSEKAFHKLKEMDEECEQVDYRIFNKKYNERDIYSRRRMKELINSEENRVEKVFSTLI